MLNRRLLRLLTVLPAVGLVVAFVVALSGCQSPPPIVPADLFPQPIKTTLTPPGYRQLIARYNHNIRQMSRIWASTDVRMVWRDRKGKRQTQSGDGVLIIVRPRKIAMTVGKLGHTGLWIGSNATRYWLLNLEDKTAYVGLYQNLDRPCTEPLPLPVPPQAVAYLLGIMPIDPAKVPPPPAVEMFGGYALIEPPGLHIRMLLDPRTAEPVRIDWLNDRGQSTLVSRLSERRRMRLDGRAEEHWPNIAHQVKIYAPGREARLDMQLYDVTDGRRENKISPNVFNWSVLVKTYRPKHIIDLDRDCR